MPRHNMKYIYFYEIKIPNKEDATLTEAAAFKVSDLLDEKYAETSILKVQA